MSQSLVPDIKTDGGSSGNKLVFAVSEERQNCAIERVETAAVACASGQNGASFVDDLEAVRVERGFIACVTELSYGHEADGRLRDVQNVA